RDLHSFPTRRSSDLARRRGRGRRSRGSGWRRYRSDAWGQQRQENPRIVPVPAMAPYPLQMNAPQFPISPLLPQIQQHLAVHPRLVLEAPPGAGKTTQVPLALLDAPWLEGRRIILLEPRRVAARSAAMFMARQLGEEVGGIVGYRIRFENKVSARTRIEVVTEGILT